MRPSDPDAAAPTDSSPDSSNPTAESADSTAQSPSGADPANPPSAASDRSNSPSVAGDEYRLRDGARLAGDVLVSRQPLAATRLNDAAVETVGSLAAVEGFRSVETLAEEVGADPKAVASLCERLRGRGFLEWRPARDPDFRPPVSVVVTVRNDREDLRACLDALAALAYPTYEVVVVDDGSTDGTREVASAHPLADEGRLRVIEVGSPETPLGIGASRNRGVEAAAHGVVAFTDADCRPRPEWLSDLVPHLAAADLVGGRIRPAGSDPASAYEAHNSSLDMGPYASRVDPAGDTPYLATANAIGRRRVFESVPFPERSVAEDVDVCWRALDAGFEVTYVPRGVVEHDYRTGVGDFAARRAAYGASEALLSRAYGSKYTGERDGSEADESASVGVSTASLAVAALAALGIATSRLGAALALAGALLVVTAALGSVRRWGQYRRLAPAVAAGDVVRSWVRERVSSAYALSREIARYYALPLVVVGALAVGLGLAGVVPGALPFGAGLVVATAVAVALPLAVEYRVYDPDASFPAYAKYYLADHFGYQRGVYHGAFAHRTLEHLRPDARFRLTGFGANAVERAAEAVLGAVRAGRSP